jgi:DNA polymerase-3 subunit alpha
LKNVGVEAMRHVVEVRSDGGDFIDLFDFARRVDTRIVNKRAFENLARGGAFDCLEPNRAKAFSSSLILQQIGSRSAQEKASEQANLFSGEVDFMVEPDLPNVTAWTGLEQLDNELSAIGFYLGGHPLDAFLPALERKKAIMAIDLENFCNSGGRAVRLAGVVRKRQERVSKRGKRFAFMSISDPTGDFEVLVGEDLLVSNRTIMDPGTLLELTAKAEVRDGEVRLFANTINLLELKEEKNTAKGLEIRLRSAELCVLDEFEKVLLSLKDAPSKPKVS